MKILDELICSRGITAAEKILLLRLALSPDGIAISESTARTGLYRDEVDRGARRLARSGHVVRDGEVIRLGPAPDAQALARELRGDDDKQRGGARKGER